MGICVWQNGDTGNRSTGKHDGLHLLFAKLSTGEDRHRVTTACTSMRTARTTIAKILRGARGRKIKKHPKFRHGGALICGATIQHEN